MSATDRRERFEKFHAANPAIYRELVRLAREAKAAGLEKIGIRALRERLRWWVKVEVRRAGEYRLNDHLPAYYSRLIMEQEWDLAEFFETRDRDDDSAESDDFHAAEGQRPTEAAVEPLGEQKAGAAERDLGTGSGLRPQSTLFPELDAEAAR